MVTWSNAVLVSLFVLVLQAPCCLSFTRYYTTTASLTSGGWPKGPFTLLQPASGCPYTGSWDSGFLHQDTEDTLGGNHFSMDIHHYLKGQFAVNDIETHYCTNRGYDGPDWPSGSYCIMRHGYQCPNGFQDGFIKWDDEDHENGNRVYGTLPDELYRYNWGYSVSNIKIYYCCRDDGQPDQPISLPTDFTFVLVRNGLQCQQVANMELHEIYIRWDDEDTNNIDEVGGAHPYDDGGDHDHKLYFCHYQMNVNSTAHGSSVIG